eukprot:COSAG01_NODE_154_length_23851_cov_159.173999_13_plen_101_part_00
MVQLILLIARDTVGCGRAREEDAEDEAEWQGQQRSRARHGGCGRPAAWDLLRLLLLLRCWCRCPARTAARGGRTGGGGAAGRRGRGRSSSHAAHCQLPKT